MREFDGFSGIAALAGQRGQCDGERAQSDGVIGVDYAGVVQAQAAVEIEAARQAAEVANRVGGGGGEELVVVGAKLDQHGGGWGKRAGLGGLLDCDSAMLGSE